MSASRRLRVLHVLPSMHGYGAERQVMQLLSRLDSDDVSAGLLTVYAPTDEQIRSAGFPVLSASRNGRRDVAFVQRMVQRIREFDPDVVHAHTHVGKYWGRFAAAAAGVRSIVYTEHNPCDPRRSALDVIAGRALNPHTTRCVTFFPEQRELIERLDRIPAQKIEIIPNGIDFGTLERLERKTSRLRLGLPEPGFVVMLVGRMEHQKNHALALEALAAMRPHERERITLLFAGSGVLEPALQKTARVLGVEAQTHFLGYRSDVPELLAAADLVLMTSHFEGMPLALLEAMHAGVPVLTVPWTGAATMLGGGAYGRVAPDWSPANVAQAIVEIIVDPAPAAAAAQRARAHVEERYTLERMAEAHRHLNLEMPVDRRVAA